MKKKNNVYLQSHIFVYQDLWNLFLRTRGIHVKLKAGMLILIYEIKS